MDKKSAHAVWSVIGFLRRRRGEITGGRGVCGLRPRAEPKARPGGRFGRKRRRAICSFAPWQTLRFFNIKIKKRAGGGAAQPPALLEAGLTGQGCVRASKACSHAALPCSPHARPFWACVGGAPRPRVFYFYTKTFFPPSDTHYPRPHII